MFTIYATNMVYAQGTHLTAEQRNALTQRADARRAKYGDNGPESIRVEVRDPRHPEMLLGHMTYTM